MNPQIVVLLGLAGLFVWWVSGKVRGRIQTGPATKRAFLIVAPPMMVLGLLAIFWLPEQIPFNRESPAGIFTVYLPCFTIGAGLFFGGIGAILGAALSGDRR